MKFKHIITIAAVIFLCLLSNMSHIYATALTLNYHITDIGGGIYNYEFNLLLDNNDGTWVPGQGWRWLIFGDVKSQPSPLTDFIGDPNDLPVGPWTYFTMAAGYHNGPTLGSVIKYWIPSHIGDQLNWSGTSTAYLGQGDLRFSTIAGTLNGGIPANFETANYTNPPSAVPEPGTIILLGIGITGFGLFCGKKRKIYKDNLTGTSQD